jgi:hypothetical protein
MHINTVHSMRIYPALAAETRSHVETGCAAFHLNRKPQTMRTWACLGGALQPIRIGGRLAWSVADIRNLLAGGTAQ